MSLPPAPIPLGMASSIGMAAINPIEHIFMGLNTNPYFIGLMMLLLNLGGRFIGLEVSKDQEKFFQHPYVRRALIFTVLFVATRNVFVAGIMTIFVLIAISYLFNENSGLCLWKTETETKDVIENFAQLTPEESEILRRLLEKQSRIDAANKKPLEKNKGQQLISIDDEKLIQPVKQEKLIPVQEEKALPLEKPKLIEEKKVSPEMVYSMNIKKLQK